MALKLLKTRKPGPDAPAGSSSAASAPPESALPSARKMPRFAQVESEARFFRPEGPLYPSGARTSIIHEPPGCQPALLR